METVLIFDSRARLPLASQFLLKKISKNLVVKVLSPFKAGLLKSANVSQLSLSPIDYDLMWPIFRRKYVHLSPNPFEYELACFERYFAYEAAARKLGISRFWVMDTDVWPFEGLVDWEFQVLPVLSSTNPDDAVSAHCALFSYEALLDFLQYLVSTYFSSNRLPVLTEEFRLKTLTERGGINDMTALAAWLESSGRVWTNSEGLSGMGRISHNFASLKIESESTCRIKLNALSASVSRAGKLEETYAAIHFQGGSKYVPYFIALTNGLNLARGIWASASLLSGKLCSVAQILASLRSAALNFKRN